MDIGTYNGWLQSIQWLASIATFPNINLYFVASFDWPMPCWLLDSIVLAAFEFMNVASNVLVMEYLSTIGTSTLPYFMVDFDINSSILSPMCHVSSCVSFVIGLEWHGNSKFDVEIWFWHWAFTISLPFNSIFHCQSIYLQNKSYLHFNLFTSVKLLKYNFQLLFNHIASFFHI